MQTRHRPPSSWCNIERVYLKLQSSVFALRKRLNCFYFSPTAAERSGWVATACGVRFGFEFSADAPFSPDIFPFLPGIAPALRPHLRAARDLRRQRHFRD